MQETHSSKKLIKAWQKEWGSKWIASSGQTNARGVAILLNPKFRAKVVSRKTDHEGRYVFCRIKTEDNIEYSLCNIYAPNQDNPGFFKSVFKTVFKFANENIIIGGDFNMTLHPELDRSKTTGVNNNNSMKYVNSVIDELQLCDVWRVRNPDCKRFTWFRPNGQDRWASASRLDYFLLNPGAMQLVNDITISSAYKTDHSLVTLLIEHQGLKKGPGIWKFNNKLLNEKNYCEKIKKLIAQISAKPNLHRNPAESWDYLKQEIAALTKEYAKNRTRDRKVLLQNLYQLNYELQHSRIRSPTLKQIEETQTAVLAKIDCLETEQTEGAMFRSRAKWEYHKDRMSKFFFNLEKRNYIDKTMTCIILDNGNICREQQTILKEQEKFYRSLYTRDENIVFNLVNKSGTTISNTQREMLDSAIDIEEIFTALKSMKPNKVAGLDGLNKEFYVHFWKELKPPLWNMIQFVLNRQELGYSCRTGVISLLPKKNKDPRIIRNLRPLTLLNTDYKIIAKVLATCLKKVLPSIIGQQQTGFMEGRSIHSNLRKTIDIITHIYQSGKRAVVVSIDFEKCFDHIEHQSMWGAMKYFQFGDTFIGWVRTLFTNFRICTFNAGYLSDPFSKTRGLNQGCNYSPFGYNICGEIMAHLIKSNQYIKGVKMSSEVTHTISQFANDTALFLMYTESCINATLDTLALVECNTGLKISYEKTTIYRIGSLKNSNAECYTTKQIKWSDGDIELLGIYIQNASSQNSIILDQALVKMENVANRWDNQNLTWMGKALCINTLMASLFVYSMIVTPLISPSQEKKFYEIINKFLWKDKRSKIPLGVLQNSKEGGGLGIARIRDKHKALHIQWIPKIVEEGNNEFEYVYQLLIPSIGREIWNCNLNDRDIKEIIAPSYWHDVLTYWSEISFIEPQDFEEIANH